MKLRALQGAALQRAIALRAAGWGFARIGAELGVCEAAATNAILIAQCKRPAQRDAKGALLPAELERLREMLRKGFKGVEIVAAMGVTASFISHERRRYNADLKARGKRPLPPPGNGAAYSGARVPKSKKKEVEALFLEGYGNRKINERTGVSMTHIWRIRRRLVARLRRKGQTLTGCDRCGKRHAMRDHARAIADEQRAKFRELLLQRVPVRRAAGICGIGSSSAYRIRDALKEEMGGALPPPRLPGRVRPLESQLMAAQAIPKNQLWRFRKLVREHGDAEARRILRAEAAEARRNRTFEEQLEAVRNGATLGRAFRPRKPDPSMTLGGVTAEAM